MNRYIGSFVYKRITTYVGIHVGSAKTKEMFREQCKFVFGPFYSQFMSIEPYIGAISSSWTTQFIPDVVFDNDPEFSWTAFYHTRK